MKKTLVLACIIFLAAGCNKEKNYSNALAGKWTVYKYLLNTADQTPLFQSRYIGFNITFTSGGAFTENYGIGSDTLISGTLVPDTLNVRISGTYSFTNQDNMLVLTASSYIVGDSVNIHPNYVQDYTIFDLSSADVQLVTDTSRLYMTKSQ